MNIVYNNIVNYISKRTITNSGCHMKLSTGQKKTGNFDCFAAADFIFTF